MVINDEKRFVFIHVPKSAGSSITAMLGGKSTAWATHTPAARIPEYARGFFTFGFIRNPWDRMVSLYHFLCQKTFRTTDNFRQDEVRAAGFKMWLMDGDFMMQEDYLALGEPWVVGGVATHLLPPMQRRPQMFWLSEVDYIGRVESIEEDWLEICATAGIPFTAIVKTNTTKHGHYSKYYDDESAHFVAKHFTADILEGNYEF